MENSQTIRVTPGSSSELDLEPREINLSLRAGRRLKPHLERRDRIGSDAAHGTLHGGVATGVTAIPQLTPQPHGGKAGEGCKPLAQIGQERISASLLRWSRAIGWWLQTARDVSANGFAIDAKLSGNG